MTWKRLLLLGVALVASGLSAPLIRLAGTTPLAIVAWRVVLACPPMIGVAATRRQPCGVGHALPAGALLAMYWILGVLAIQLSSVASAAVLLCTGALWSAVLSRPLLGERVSARHWAGLVVALAGVIVVVTEGDPLHHHFVGNLCAVGGSLCWVGYTFVGRRARPVADFWGYSATLYATAGVVVVGAAVSSGEALTGLSSMTWLVLCGLALVPTLLAHGIYNYLLRYIPPATLSLCMLSKPIAAAALAWVLFSELPTSRMIGGSAAILVGITLGVITPPPSWRKIEVGVRAASRLPAPQPSPKGEGACA